MPRKTLASTQLALADVRKKISRDVVPAAEVLLYVAANAPCTLAEVRAVLGARGVRLVRSFMEDDWIAPASPDPGDVSHGELLITRIGRVVQNSLADLIAHSQVERARRQRAAQKGKTT